MPVVSPVGFAQLRESLTRNKNAECPADVRCKESRQPRHNTSAMPRPTNIYRLAQLVCFVPLQTSGPTRAARVTFENSPSHGGRGPAIHPLHFGGGRDKRGIRRLRRAVTMKLAPSSAWNVAPMLRSELKSCAHATRPRSAWRRLFRYEGQTSPNSGPNLPPAGKTNGPITP